MDAELAVSSTSTDSWKTGVINKRMVGKVIYQYKYSIWIKASVLLANARPLEYVKKYKMLLSVLISMYKHEC